ncbi:MAG: IS30 family transposase [Planctomycetes bacterium]|nr:IS30 family transposase [Planctomycetota bacterium]
MCHHPRSLMHTLTYDNGSENVEHVYINQVLGTQSYFCNPYHSWEKGTVENTNSIIRRYLPKKTDFATITTVQIRTIERLMNNRPRKCLGYKTPLEVFSSIVALTG